MDKNEVDVNTGKGKFCSKLTLVKGIKRGITDGEIVKLDETREPNSKLGLGRKTLVYIRREYIGDSNTRTKSAKSSTPAVKVAPNPVKATVRAKTPTKDVADYDAKKAALLAPTPSVSIPPVSAPATTPAVTTPAVNPIVA
jgi:hypothetical protein